MENQLRVAKRASGLQKRYARGKRYFPSLDLQNANLVGLKLECGEFTRSNFYQANLNRVNFQFIKLIESLPYLN